MNPLHPGWIFGDLISPRQGIEILIIISTLTYLFMFLDTTRQAYLRNGNPLHRRNLTPVAFAEWMIALMISGSVSFGCYRFWNRFIEHNGNNDPRLFYIDLYRLVGLTGVYFGTHWARRWVISELAEKDARIARALSVQRELDRRLPRLEGVEDGPSL